ncbi:uncharacterized protein LOC127879382 isoform X1 [Dreissena polymorpha]|uniref:Uncharacterized protein n=1 Tax=Dreissena polymorpha TaxID=45954 RepID=A0A9D4K5A8_DREPO|nr:uncharacterized protein LOC127879382 isoform X1 [Dreissena polymorpha]KAH3833318.1 hypothetical protein DPMN_106624 [Dreissena polymorpha]
MTTGNHDTLQGTSCMYKLKVVLIGDISVGKTSIALRFVSNSFQDGYRATIGATYISKTAVIDDDVICFQIWDTAGQERYKSLVPMYLRGAHIAFIVYDVTERDSFKSLQWWLDTLQEHGDILKAVVVGNKCDLVSVFDDLEPVTLAQERGLQFATVSAKTGQNIEELFHIMGSRAVSEMKRRENKPTRYDTIALQRSLEISMNSRKRSCCK